MNNTLRDAARALHEQKFELAEQLARECLNATPRDADAWHLLGLVRRSRDDYGEAIGCLAKAIEFGPPNAELFSNFAQLLLAFGRREDALQAFRDAVVIAPTYRPARLGLARLLNDLGQHAPAFDEAMAMIRQNGRDAESWAALAAALVGLGRIDEALAAFREALDIDPAYAAARANFVATLAMNDQPEAVLGEIARAKDYAPHSLELLRSEATALVELDRYDAAEAVLNDALREAPFDQVSLRLLTQLCHIRGDADPAARLRAAALEPNAPASLRAELADILRRRGELGDAERVLRELLEQQGPSPELQSQMATLLHEAGRIPQACELAVAAWNARPMHVGIGEGAVAALLSAGDAAGALKIVEPMASRYPADQRWITYRADIARLRGEALFADWCDADALVQTFQISPPAGYRSLDDFLVAVRAVLHPRHWQQREPLDQSLRGGTQSSRGLLHDPDPDVQALLGTFVEPIIEYQRRVGRKPPAPLAHIARYPARMRGCWSVRLRKGGAHVNHIHPEGTISSAFYLTVPPETSDLQQRSGWIHFGEPRWPVPGATALRQIQPVAGMLVLFPSYFWHGTTALRDDAPRVTVPFDATVTAPMEVRR